MLLSEVAYLTLFFTLAVLSDWLTLKWHSARENQKIFLVVLLSVVLESLTWLPVWFAISFENPWIALVSVLGSAAGSALGMRNITR